MHTDYSTFALEIHDGVAEVAFDNPPMNLFDAGLLTELSRFVEEVARAEDKVRVIVFNSSDPDFFIAHGDMSSALDFDAFNDISVAGDEGESLNPMMRLNENIRQLPQVTIGKLRGLARGGGAEFFSALDLRFASIERAGLGFMEARLGILPGAGGTAYLPALVGRSRALEIILGGQLVDAATAERYGWVNRAVPDELLDTVVSKLAARISQLPPGVVRAVTESVDANQAPLDAGLRVADGFLGQLITRPVAGEMAKAVLENGAQTRDVERHLERLVDNVTGHTTSDPEPRWCRHG